MFDFIRSLEPTYISKNVEYDKTSADGRMFNNSILYCEGAHIRKSYSRNIRHLHILLHDFASRDIIK